MTTKIRVRIIKAEMEYPYQKLKNYLWYPEIRSYATLSKCV